MFGKLPNYEVIEQTQSFFFIQLSGRDFGFARQSGQRCKKKPE